MSDPVRCEWSTDHACPAWAVTRYAWTNPGEFERVMFVCLRHLPMLERVIGLLQRVN